MNKTNRSQNIIYILIVMNLFFSFILLFLIFKVNSGINYLTERDTKNNIILAEKLECYKKPTTECEDQILKLEAEFKAWNERQLK